MSPAVQRAIITPAGAEVVDMDKPAGAEVVDMDKLEPKQRVKLLARIYSAHRRNPIDVHDVLES